MYQVLKNNADCKQYIMLLYVSKFGCFTWPQGPTLHPVRTISMLLYCDAALQ